MSDIANLTVEEISALDFNSLSLAELEAVVNNLAGQRRAIQHLQREAQRAITAKEAEASARRKVAQMSDAEREAVIQVIAGAGGIASKAELGIPGAK